MDIIELVMIVIAADDDIDIDWGTRYCAKASWILHNKADSSFNRQGRRCLMITGWIGWPYFCSQRKYAYFVSRFFTSHPIFIPFLFCFVFFVMFFYVDAFLWKKMDGSWLECRSSWPRWVVRGIGKLHYCTYVFFCFRVLISFQRKRANEINRQPSQIIEEILYSTYVLYVVHASIYVTSGEISDYLDRLFVLK